MEDVQVAQDGAEGETDLSALYLDGRYEELLVAADAEWNRKNPEDLAASAALAAIATAQLGRRDVGLEWLARSPTPDLTRFDHLLLADANLSLGRVEEARRHRSASATARSADRVAEEALEVVVAARLDEDFGALEPLSAERLTLADPPPDRVAAGWLIGDRDCPAALAVSEWAATAGRPWATEPNFWLNLATSAAGSGRFDLVVRALESRTGSWAPELAQQGDFQLAAALFRSGERARAAETASRAAGLKGPLQDRAACQARLYACDPDDLHCQFDAWKAWWKLVQADDEPDPDERTAVGTELLLTGISDLELGRLALGLVGSVVRTDPLAPMAGLTLGFIAISEQRYEEALSLLDTVDQPDDVRAQHLVMVGRARALFELNRLEEALAASSSARAMRAKFWPGVAEPILPIDLAILERARRWGDLADAARLALSSSVTGGRPLAAQVLVIALVELRDLDAAVAQERSMVEEHDEVDADLAARILVADVCRLGAKYKEALALLGDDVPKASDRLRLGRWVQCIAIAERRGDIDATIEALRGAQRWMPIWRACSRSTLPSTGPTMPWRFP